MAADSDFTVLMAVYYKDDPLLLDRALKSIVINDVRPFEIIIVADGDLTADLIDVIDSYAAQISLNFIRLPQNVGLARALNAGLEKIKTPYTIRADADDYNYINRFEILIGKLKEGFDLVGSAIREIDKDGTTIAFRNCPLSEEDIRIFAKKRNPFNHMTVGFCTNAVVSAGGYPSIHLKEDYALWATLLSKGCKVCNLSNVLVDATAGTEMFRRRGGFRYALAEVDLQIHLVRCRLKTPLRAVFDGVLRSAVFLAPNSLREFVYLKFLRIDDRQ